RDMDGDGIPDHRDSDKNGNGIRDWEEEQLAKRQARAARKLFNEFWTGLSDIDRQQWRKDYAQGKLDMLQAFISEKQRNLAREIPPHSIVNGIMASPRTSGATIYAAQAIEIEGATEEETQEILAFFEEIYGEKGMILLRAYLRAGNTITVEDKWDFWWKFSDLEGVAQLNIQIDDSLNPAEI